MPNRKNTGVGYQDEIESFHKGANYHCHHMLGAHSMVDGDKQGTLFQVWAPHAVWVSVVGDFNQWDTQSHRMEHMEAGGIWSLFIPEVVTHDLYKFAIGTRSGEILYKADPYAFYSEVRPDTASIVYDLTKYTWSDDIWQQNKKNSIHYDKPMAIYEVHLGSWKLTEDRKWMDYRTLAVQLVSYVKEMGFTHIELMPVMEHPYDGSWGYQVTGYYAVTSRYGSPEDFMYLVDLCHQNGVGVILDWVPGHFPKDAHGLSMFDGTPLYEPSDPCKREHPQWGTLTFDYGKYEVRSFLISNVVFWMEYYHIDGFRVDAVSSLLYLDYARDQWTPNKFGGRENLDAEVFLKELNKTVHMLYPGTLMIAEDSSQWPHVTGEVEGSGLGFDFKWNMGWMNDTLRYCSMDPLFRKGNHDLITFSMTYAFSENFMLPLSHDEVVHGKQSLLDKMFGDYNQKFAGLRVLYAYQYAHPGKKLIFMGGEYGQFIEWKYDDSLDWHLLGYDMHRKMSYYMKELNHFYLQNNSLWEDDGGWNGFQWISPDDRDRGILSFIRTCRYSKEFIIAIFHFTPVLRENYLLGVPSASAYQVIFNSDKECYGGNQALQEQILPVTEEPCHGFEQSITLMVPPLSALFLKAERETAYLTSKKED